MTAATFNLSNAAGAPQMAPTPRPCESEMAIAAREQGVPLAVLYSIGLTETGRRNALQPFALNINGKSYFASSLDEALDRFVTARKAGLKLIDVGCMQINHHYHGARFASVRDMFDPRQNVRYAATFLRQLRQREGSWTLAVARYNAGPNNDPAQKRYVCAVIVSMVTSGMGRWTAPARVFCGHGDKPEASPVGANGSTNAGGRP